MLFTIDEVQKWRRLGYDARWKEWRLPGEIEFLQEEKRLFDIPIGNYSGVCVRR